MTTIVLVLALATTATRAPQNTTAPQRFDYLVRADFFAGIAGDEARMKKAMDLCEKMLAENPNHAEALVWHGAGLFGQAGAAFQKGDATNGRTLFDRGIAEMNRAVTLAPDNPGVLIPRAAVLLEGTRAMPLEAARPLLESALRNYERVLEVQAPIFGTLGDHPKGELLFGLAEGYGRLGDAAKARAYFERLLADAPASGQAPKAKQWLETGTIPASKGPSCVGCHR